MANIRHLHIIDLDPERRATLARTGYACGYHVEIYSDATEFISSKTRDGIVLLHDAGLVSEVGALHQALAALGRWHPIVGHSENPSIARVVEAIRSGALSFASTPQSVDEIEDLLNSLDVEVERLGALRQACAAACANIAKLSLRERQVLERLVHGDSNKTIARQLEISPRTVEIHRMKMLGKLGAKSSADAIRLRVEANFSLLAAA